MSSTDERSEQVPSGQQELSRKHEAAVCSWVLKARRLLEEDFDAQLESLGLRRLGGHSPAGRAHLSGSAIVMRQRVQALLSQQSDIEAERGYRNVVRALAYTALNRLVGLKVMEARQLLYLPPPGSPDAPPERTEVITPLMSQRLSRYLQDLQARDGSRYGSEEALLHGGLTAAFRHLAQEAPLLFDPDHEYSCVWPSHTALVEVLRMLNEGLPEDAYREQDFIGWIYQYYNLEERQQGHRTREDFYFPSSDLVGFSQFYTPPWVVKVLVDNTLGRLWLQMHPDSALRPAAPRPSAGTWRWREPVADYLVPRTGEHIRYQRLTESGQVETFKLARDITLLDPACGTMQFGRYAFGLFYRMYLEELEHAGKPGWPAEPSVRQPRDIPAAILEHNLFGTDIDPRAIQLASLSLMLTAREAAREHGLSLKEASARRANLVIASRDGAVERGASDKLRYIDEFGSLLPVHDLEPDALAEAALSAESPAPVPTLPQMLSRSYDIIVMTPPVGRFSPRVKSLIKAAYPSAYNDIYESFIERATQLVEHEGYVGALVPQTFATLGAAHRLREEILLKRNPLLLMLDLGGGIFNSLTGMVAIVLRGGAR